MKMLQLPESVVCQKLQEKFPENDFEYGASLAIGSVRPVILRRIQKPKLCKLIIKSEIAAGVASKLLMLDSTYVFSFEAIMSNAAVFRPFVDAVCLNDILKLRVRLPFEPDHALVLAADILSGIRALRDVGLQRNSFSQMDILLVRLQHHDECYFQIAGIESCTHINHTYPSRAREEVESLVRLLELIKKYLVKEVNRTSSFIRLYRQVENLISRLESIACLDRSVSEVVEAAEQLLPMNDYSEVRKEELPTYLLYSKVFGTVLEVAEAG